jgi:outer membrane receptor for ferrienterochelin and colicins
MKTVKNICTLALLLASTTAASAQTIDYGALEELFGESVTTSATGQPQRAPDVPVSMEIITADQIRKSGAQNIPQALKHVSGISSLNWSRGQYDLSVRGYNQATSSRLLVLVNGRQVYQDDYAFTNWASIPVQLSEIRQIEVVKGPNTALFGFNAVGGVVNIITYNPMYDAGLHNATVTAGTDGYWKGSAVYSGKATEKLGVRLSAGAQRSDDFSNKPFFAPPYSDNREIDPRQHEFNLDSIYQVTDKSQLRVEASTSRAYTDTYIYFYHPLALDYMNKSLGATYSADTSLGMVNARLYTNWMTATAPHVNGESNRQHVTVAQLEDVFQAGNDHSFRLSTEARNNKLGGPLSMEGADSNINYNVYSAGGTWEWKVHDGVTLTNALRGDHLRLWRNGGYPATPINPLALPAIVLANPVYTNNEIYNTSLDAFSYNSGLVWNATTEDTLRVSTARGIQVPSLLEYGNYLDVLGPSRILGNPRLKPTVVTNYELGYDRKIAAINGLARASVFYQVNRDLKAGTGAFDNAAYAFIASNIGDSRTVGLELGLSGKIGEKWSWDANYTLQDVNDDLTYNNTGVGAAPVAPEQMSALHTANAHLGYASGPWEADAYLRFVSRYQIPSYLGGAVYGFKNISPAVSLDARVGYKVSDNLTVAVSGQQLERSNLEQTTGPETERQMFLTLSSNF